MQYNPEIIVEFANRLYAQATRIALMSATLGFLIGLAVGAGLSVSTSLGGAPVIVSMVLGSLVGFIIGNERAFMLKLRAQEALCALQTEINTRGLSALRQPMQPAQQPYVYQQQPPHR